MPYLKTILVNANDKANCMLRAKSMECISLVGMAVGKDKFRDDAKQVGFMHNNSFSFLRSGSLSLSRLSWNTFKMWKLFLTLG
jgi:hypothetical protein